jgi:TRAP-type uncharacterized transport system fused permease subunit
MVKIWVNLRDKLSLGRWVGVMVRVVLELGALLLRLGLGLQRWLLLWSVQGLGLCLGLVMGFELLLGLGLPPQFVSTRSYLGLI